MLWVGLETLTLSLKQGFDLRIGENFGGQGHVHQLKLKANYVDNYIDIMLPN